MTDDPCPGGLTATAQIGRPPHPSIALIDVQWLEAEFKTVPAYVRVMARGKELGVLQALDSGLRTEEEVYLDPRLWLSRLPRPASTICLYVASKKEFVDWRVRHTRPRFLLFLASLGCALAAGVIELFWSAGKYWTWWYPSNFWAGSSQVAKWALLALGVGGIAAYKDYNSLERRIE
jgi:hypothetical protein